MRKLKPPKRVWLLFDTTDGELSVARTRKDALAIAADENARFGGYWIVLPCDVVAETGSASADG